VTATIVSLKDLCDPSQTATRTQTTIDQFDIYVGCLISTSYALSDALLSPMSASSMQLLGRLVDDPALLTKIAAHGERQKLCNLLLGLIMAETARSSLWTEMENLLAS
jgi:hypothetical protein